MDLSPDTKLGVVYVFPDIKVSVVIATETQDERKDLQSFCSRWKLERRHLSGRGKSLNTYQYLYLLNTGSLERFSCKERKG